MGTQDTQEGTGSYDLAIGAVCALRHERDSAAMQLAGLLRQSGSTHAGGAMWQHLIALDRMLRASLADANSSAARSGREPLRLAGQ